MSLSCPRGGLRTSRTSICPRAARVQWLWDLWMLGKTSAWTSFRRFTPVSVLAVGLVLDEVEADDEEPEEDRRVEDALDRTEERLDVAVEKPCHAQTAGNRRTGDDPAEDDQGRVKARPVDAIRKRRRAPRDGRERHAGER